MKNSSRSRKFDLLMGRRSGRAKSPEEWVPPWAKEPLLADEPMLPQLEKKLLAVDDEKEFRRGLEWLAEKFFLDPDRRDCLEGMGLKERDRTRL